MDDIRQACTKYLKSGFNCAEGVLIAVAEHFGIESDHVPRVATGFGAGMGCSDGQCGALSGAIMALGLLLGRDEAGQRDKKNMLYEKTKRLVEEFVSSVGSRDCSEIVGFDLADDPEFERYHSEDCGTRLCRPAAGEAAALAVRIAEES